MHAISINISRVLLSLSLLVALAAIAACQNGTDGSESSDGTAPAAQQSETGDTQQAAGETSRHQHRFDEAHTFTSNVGTYELAITPKPAAFPMNEPFDITVRVTAANDSSSTEDDVDLTVDAAMPEHGHGMNQRPEVNRVQDDVFIVKGMLLHMPGRWEIYFDVTRNGRTERAQFELNLE